MRIVIVCGVGVGSSILLKMTTEKVLRSLGVQADVEVADLATAQTPAQNADIVLTSAEFLPDINPSARIITVDNFVSEAEVTEKLQAALAES